MNDYEIVPDVLSELPKKALSVTYENGVKVDQGNVLTPTQVQNKPTIHFEDADASTLYTLLFTDPDAPSRSNPIRREFHHWMRINIPGNDFTQGEDIYDYIGSGPPSGSGLHRYIFILFPQKGKIPSEEAEHKTNSSIEGRPFQKTSDIITKYDLENPVAINLYQAEYDSYVDELYKKIGIKR